MKRLFSLNLMLILAVCTGAKSQVICQWSALLSQDSTSNDYCMDMALDSDGNVCVTGFSGDSFGMSANCLTAKYGPDGDCLWKQFFDRGGVDVGEVIACDPVGNTYVAGTSYLNSGDTTGGIVTIKYNNRGALQWYALHRGNQGSNPDNKEMGIAVDSTGNAYLCFRNRRGSEFMTVLKYSPDGILLWEREFDTGSGEGNRIALRGDFIYAVGFNYFDGGPTNLMIVKLNADGDTVWTREFDGPDNDIDYSGAVEIDDFGNIIIGAETMTDSNAWCPMVVKYDPDGNVLWYGVLPSHGFGSVLSIDTDPAGNVYLAGTINPQPRFNSDFYTAQYSATGELLWYHVFPDNRVNFIYECDIKVDDIGYSYATFTAFMDSSTNAVLISYDPWGNLNWLTSYDSPGYSDDYGRELELNDQGDIYAGGLADIDSKRSDSLSTHVNHDVFIAKFARETQRVGPREDGALPKSAAIHTYPNPFNAQTTICYSLSEPGSVSLAIYNLLGQKVATLFEGPQQTGEHRAVWNANEVPSGVYFARLEAADKIATSRMILLR